MSTIRFSRHSFVQNREKESRFNIGNVVFTGAVDDAQAFIDAAGITDGTQQSAIQTLVTDLKTAGVWSKMYAIYPFVGGTATTHKYNLKDPRDLDAAFRITFNGGWTHNSNGITGNGSNTNANTFVVPNSFGDWLNNSSLGIYSRTNSAINAYDISFTVEGVVDCPIVTRYGSGIAAAPFPLAVPGANPTTSLGFWQARRTSDVQRMIQDTTERYNAAASSYSISTHNIFIGAKQPTPISNPAVFNEISSRNYAFAYIGQSLTDTEQSNYYTAVNTFQTTLGRNV